MLLKAIQIGGRLWTQARKISQKLSTPLLLPSCLRPGQFTDFKCQSSFSKDSLGNPSREGTLTQCYWADSDSALQTSCRSSAPGGWSSLETQRTLNKLLQPSPTRGAQQGSCYAPQIFRSQAWTRLLECNSGGGHSHTSYSFRSITNTP